MNDSFIFKILKWFWILCEEIMRMKKKAEKKKRESEMDSKKKFMEKKEIKKMRFNYQKILIIIGNL